MTAISRVGVAATSSGLCECWIVGLVVAPVCRAIPAGPVFGSPRWTPATSPLDWTSLSLTRMVKLKSYSNASGVLIGCQAGRDCPRCIGESKAPQPWCLVILCLESPRIVKHHWPAKGRVALVARIPGLPHLSEVEQLCRRCGQACERVLNLERLPRPWPVLQLPASLLKKRVAFSHLTGSRSQTIKREHAKHG